MLKILHRHYFHSGRRDRYRQRLAIGYSGSFCQFASRAKEANWCCDRLALAEGGCCGSTHSPFEEVAQNVTEAHGFSTTCSTDVVPAPIDSAAQPEQGPYHAVGGLRS
jgi:hypothetical protein